MSVEITDVMWRQAAYDKWDGPDIDVDNYDDEHAAEVSVSDEGAFVQAWVWVSNEEVGR